MSRFLLRTGNCFSAISVGHDNPSHNIRQKCFGSSFADCWVKFVQDFPVVADRTVTLLGVAIVAFAKDVLPLKESQMAIGINQVISQTAILLKMQDQIDVLTQALTVEKAHPADRKRDNNFNVSVLSIPPSSPTSNNNNNNNTHRRRRTRCKQSRRNKNKKFRQHAKDRSLLSVAAVNINGKNQVRANADSGATGNYLTVADISVLRDVCISAPAQRITVAVANGTLLQSTHHGFLDVPGHGAMIAYIFPQLRGSLLSISQLVNVGLRVTYCPDFVTGFDTDNNMIFKATETSRPVCGWWT